MASNIMNMTPEAVAKIEAALAGMEKTLKDKDALMRTGFLSQQDINEIQTVYDSTRKLYAIYKPSTPSKV